MELERVKRRIENIKKMLESALALTKDPKRAESIKASLIMVLKDLKKIEEGTFTEEDIKKYEFSRFSSEPKQERVEFSYDILETIPQISPSPIVTDKELTDINSYLVFFEKEYLPLFTPKYLKVIYSYQHKLDYFFSEFRKNQMLFVKYVELLENIEKSESDVYITEMQKLRKKRFRELITNLDNYFEELQEFLDTILENPTSEGILLEPHFIVEFEEETKVINNIQAIEAIKDMYKFVIEFRNYLGMLGG